MKNHLLSIVLATPLLVGCRNNRPIEAKIAQSPKTFCNPVNLSYRFMKIEGGDGIREAADPVIISFRDTYYLFASKSSGYWYSNDFTNWKHVFIPDSVLPIEDYAPGTEWKSYANGVFVAPSPAGYIIRYGIAPDKLYTNFQVMDSATLEIGSLNKGTTYYFTIDTYNENGITQTEEIIRSSAPL